MILYNETLIKINLRGNHLIKVKQLIVNLARNRNSNLQILNLSNNDFEMFDVNDILAAIEDDSVFMSRQHFKLRYLTLSNC